MSFTIDKQKAKRLYADAPEWLKKELTDEFGEAHFKQQNFEEIKTFEDACKALKIKPESVYSSSDAVDEVAYKKLKVIIRAINNGWTPDWNNGNQYKWWPWFVLSSGFGLSNSDYNDSVALATVGSRLCFESEAKSNYCAQQFIDLYKDFLTINQ